MDRRFVPRPEEPNEKPYSHSTVRLLSKEMEEATNRFLLKLDQLEKLLPLVDE